LFIMLLDLALLMAVMTSKISILTFAF
jgi:hypothetical protein